MTGIPIRHPRANLSRARAIFAFPDRHPAGAMLDACETIEALSESIDERRRARRLHGDLVRDAVAELNRRARTWLFMLGMLAGGIAVVAIVAPFLIAQQRAPDAQD